MSRELIEIEALREMVEEHPEAFQGQPECPDCGNPMFGQNTEDGPWCAWGCQT